MDNKDDQIMYWKYAADNKFWELMDLYTKYIELTIDDIELFIKSVDETEKNELKDKIFHKLYSLMGV